MWSFRQNQFAMCHYCREYDATTETTLHRKQWWWWRKVGDLLSIRNKKKSFYNNQHSDNTLFWYSSKASIVLHTNFRRPKKHSTVLWKFHARWTETRDFECRLFFSSMYNNTLELGNNKFNLVVLEDSSFFTLKKT